MHNLIILRALAAHSLLYAWQYKDVRAGAREDTTTTLTSTSVVLTSTILVDADGETLTPTVPAGARSNTISGSYIATVTATAATLSSEGDSDGYIGGGTSTPTATEVVSSPDSTGGTMADYRGNNLRDAVLNSTNFFRAQHDAVPVTWNSSLAAYARDYAEKCNWSHSGGPTGENLASGFNESTLAIEAWAAEESDYNYSKARFGEKTGHFTQLVWNSTTSVGCGAVDCDSDDLQGWFLVCEYYPAGNVKGEFKANIGKEGSGGKIGMDSNEEDGGDGGDGGENGAQRLVGGGVVKRLLAAAFVVGVLML